MYIFLYIYIYLYDRYKNGPSTTTDLRKASTVKNLWWQTKAGLREAFAGAELPQFCKPRSGEVNMRINRMFKDWQKIDLSTETPKKYLLEQEIEDYCLHVIWEHMQSVEVNPVRLLHALVLRIQSGCNARHHGTYITPIGNLSRNLKQIWNKCQSNFVLYVSCVSYVSYVSYVACASYGTYVPYASYVSCMFPPCFLQGSWLFSCRSPACFLEVFCVFPASFLYVWWKCPAGFLHVSCMFPGCFL